ncbi:MAG: lysophospholipid acyltransferase family protein [Jhaorihella sp.]
MSLRRRIADSAWFNRFVEGLIAGWIRLAYRTSRWDRIGFEAMDGVLRTGKPVIVALWHQRLMMSPYLFDASLGRICTLTSGARAGRLAGQVQARFGFDTIAMSSNRRHVALSREVLGRMREGWSVGIATDGPRGPARVASTVPLVWARASGARVFVVAFSARRVIEFPTWDRMWLPAPFTRGVLMCREWRETVPRKPAEAETEALRRKLQAALDDVTDAADRAAGRAVDGG